MPRATKFLQHVAVVARDLDHQRAARRGPSRSISSSGVGARVGEQRARDRREVRVVARRTGPRARTVSLICTRLQARHKHHRRAAPSTPGAVELGRGQQPVGERRLAELEQPGQSAPSRRSGSRSRCVVDRHLGAPGSGRGGAERSAQRRSSSTRPSAMRLLEVGDPVVARALEVVAAEPPVSAIAS